MIDDGRSGAACPPIPRQISFKHAVQICIALPHHRDLHLRDDKRGLLFELIVYQRGLKSALIASSPELLKRRYKRYPLLTQPRKIVSAKIIKHGRSIS